MKAIVLVGGLGTRLRGVVSDVPKPMAPVRGRPFLSFVLDRLVDAGFTGVVFAAGYRHDTLRAHFGADYRGLPLAYSIEAEPLGTGGAIRLAWDRIGEPEVFALNGDTYAEVDLRAMQAEHLRARPALTVAICHVPDAARYGALDLAGDRVLGFSEKGRSGPGWINAGAYLLGSGLRDFFPRRDPFSFEHDLLARHVEAIRPVAFRSTGRFIDIGTPEDYVQAEGLLSTR
jgi:NDP-sugar pyrophosphorylase family protein